MDKLITEKEWIGLTIDEAIEKANSINYTHRIVEEDGESKILPYDNKSNRINFRIRKNLIIGVYTG
jgi:hypothetical protein